MKTNNILIAGFMEIKYGNERKFENDIWTHTIRSLDRFQTDWNWLMPVVEKIENTGAKVTIGRMFCEIKYTNPLNQKQHFEIRIASGVKMNAIYGAVTEFIKWYSKH